MVDHLGIPCAAGTCSNAAPNAKSGGGDEVLRSKNSYQRNLRKTVLISTIVVYGNGREFPNLISLLSDAGHGSFRSPAEIKFLATKP